MKQFRLYVPILLLITTITLVIGLGAYSYTRKEILARIASEQRMHIANTIITVEEDIKQNIATAQLMAVLPSNLALAQVDITRRNTIINTDEYAQALRSNNRFFLHFPNIVGLQIHNAQGDFIASFDSPKSDHKHTFILAPLKVGNSTFNTATCETDNDTVTYLSILLYKENTQEVIGLLRVFINIYENAIIHNQAVDADIYIVDANFKRVYTPSKQAQGMQAIDFSSITQRPLGELIYLDTTPKKIMIAQHMPTSDWYLVNVLNAQSLLYPLYSLKRLVSISVAISILALLIFTFLLIRHFTNKIDLINRNANEELHGHKQRTKLIERHNTLLNVLFETLPFGVAVCTKTKILYANAPCNNQLGVYENRNIKDIFVKPADYDAIMTLCSNKGIAQNVQTQIFDRYQRKRYMLITMKATFFAGHNAFIYWFNDNNALHVLDQQREEQYMFLQTLLDTIPQSIFFKDLNEQYAFCNRAFSLFTGLPEAFILGKTDAELHQQVPHITRLNHKPDEAIRISKNPVVTEEYIPAGEGHVRSFETTKQAYKNADNHIKGIVGTVYDITKHTLLKEELLQNERHAEIVSRGKSTFLTDISHEIRIAMSSIIGLNYLALQTELNPKLHEHLTKIEAASRKMLTLINNILDIANIDAGKITLEIAPFRLQDILRSILDIIEPLAKKKDIRLAINIEPDVPSIIMGDSLRFSQVLINILINAVQFTKQGSITLDIKVVEETEQTTTLICNIIDTGLGISAEKLGDILTQKEKTQKKVTNDHAELGLSITQGLLKLMDGRLNASSQPGHGSTFSITVMFGKPQESLHVLSSSSTNLASLTETAPATLKGLHVLVAEDNEMNQITAKEILEQFGCIVYLVNNGIEALKLIPTLPIDIILIDIQMPLMDGLSTATTLRQIPEYAHIPIIAMTAHALESDKERSLAAGMQDHIIKPINAQQLLKAMLAVLPKTYNE